MSGALSADFAAGLPVRADLLDPSEINNPGGGNGGALSAPPNGQQASNAAAQDQTSFAQSLRGSGSPLAQSNALLDRLDTAAAQKSAAMQRGMMILQAAQGNQSTNLPLLAAAGAMLRPTHTGGFAESLSNGMEAAVPVTESQRQMQNAQAQQQAQLGIEAANVPLQSAQDHIDDFWNRMKLSETAAEAAPDIRLKDIQGQQAQYQFVLMKRFQDGQGLGEPAAPVAAAAGKGASSVPGGGVTGVKAGAFLSGDSAAAGGQSSSAGSGGGSEAPLFNIGQEYQQAQRMMLSGIPAYAEIGKAKITFLDDLIKQGVLPTANGTIPLPGVAEANARKEALAAGATLPAKVLEGIASRAGNPLKLAPGETATTGAAALPPQIQATIGNLFPHSGGVSAPAADPMADYTNKVFQRESGGNPNAQNGASTSGGLAGFTDPTWIQTFKQAYPSAATSMTDAQILALKRYPVVNRQMTIAFAEQSAPVMRNAGLPVNQASLYLAHRFGPAGAVAVANADAGTPMSALLSPDVIKANPDLRNQTAGDVVRGIAKQFGTAPLGEPAAPPPAQSAAPPVATEQTQSFKAAPPPTFGVANPTLPPPDLPPSKNLAPISVIRNPDGSVTSTMNPFQKQVQDKAASAIGEIPDELKKLNDSQLLLAGLSDEVKKNAASSGWYQGGAGAQWRLDIAKTVNGVVGAAGLEQPFDKTAIADGEAFNKNSNVAAFQLARTMAGGRVALGEVTQANKAVPNLGNTPYGNVLVTHLLMQDNLHQSERLRYVWTQAQRGVDPAAAGDAFDRLNPPAKYVSTAAAGAVAQAYPQVVQALRQAPTVANIEAFNLRYGDGTAETLLGQNGVAARPAGF